MRIEIDEDLCIASGQCVLVAATVFDQREEDGTAVVIDPDPAESQRADVEDAVARCPARAIAVR